MTPTPQRTFRLTDEDLARIDRLAELLDREYERNFHRPPRVPRSRTVAIVTAVERELLRLEQR
jgi:hypothetical protein